MDEYGTYLSLRGIQMDKEVSLAAIRELYKKEWESEEDIPYAQSIYKMIDEVIEYQLDKISDGELEDFYRYHMQKHYEDKRNAIEFNDAWVVFDNSRKSWLRNNAASSTDFSFG